MHTTFRANTPSVTAESFEGEVVIINLRSGLYYSSVGTGADVWDAVCSGATCEEVINRLSGCYPGREEFIRESVTAFVDELVDQQLIVPRSDPETTENVAMKGLATNGVEFKPPVLEKFEDMEELLRLDPIHEVDETGWPVTKPAEQTASTD